LVSKNPREQGHSALTAHQANLHDCEDRGANRRPHLPHGDDVHQRARCTNDSQCDVPGESREDARRNEECDERDDTPDNHGYLRDTQQVDAVEVSWQQQSDDGSHCGGSGGQRAGETFVANF
jgi:hypothetical protein